MKCLVFLFLDIYCNIIFLQQYHAGHEVAIHNILAHGAMIWGYNLRHFRPSNHLKLFKHIFSLEKM